MDSKNDGKGQTAQEPHSQAQQDNAAAQAAVDTGVDAPATDTDAANAADAEAAYRAALVERDAKIAELKDTIAVASKTAEAAHRNRRSQARQQRATRRL